MSQHGRVGKFGGFLQHSHSLPQATASSHSAVRGHLCVAAANRAEHRASAMERGRRQLARMEAEHFSSVFLSILVPFMVRQPIAFPGELQVLVPHLCSAQLHRARGAPDVSADEHSTVGPPHHPHRVNAP